MCRVQLFLAGGVLVAFALVPLAALAVEPPGIVYESEAIATPETAWKLNKPSADHWMLWTKEQDIERKRSGGAVLASPAAAADRASPEEGAPPLHSVVADLEPGTYRVYVSNPGARPLGYSLDGEKWIRHSGSELSLGVQDLPEGRFDLWVDDRYAHPPLIPGPGYYDYVRFIPVSESERNVEGYPSWRNLRYWLEKDERGFIVPATETTDWVGFEVEGDKLKGGEPGDRFTHTIDRGGAWYFAVEMNDDEDGIERLAVDLNGEEIGCIVADALNGGIGVFSLKQPLEVVEGDTLAFTCKSSVGYYRICNLLFAKEPIIPPPPSFEHIETWSPEPGAVDLCWTTTTVVQTGTVEYGVPGQDRTIAPSDYRGRNHRVKLRGLDPAKEYEARIVTEYNGEQLVSEPIRFRPAPKTPPPTQPQTIELAVAEPTGNARHGWPATIGIPFAKGRVAKVDDLRLFDGEGEPVMLQTECFCRWPDGSVKWATVSFLADTPARYELRARHRWSDAGPSAGETATIEETDDAWRVSADAVAFDLAKKTPALFHNLGFDRNGDGQVTDDERIAADPLGANLKLETGDGEFLTCGPPEALDVEKNGPVRAVLKWSGPLVAGDAKGGWSYLVRLALWKGRPVIGLNVSVCNDQLAPRFQEVSAFALRAPLDGTGVKGGFEGRPLENVPDADGLWIHQDKDNHYSLRTADGTIEGERATGVAVAEDARTRVTVVVRDFWQTYPSGYAVKPDGVHIRLLPELTPDTYSAPEDEVRIHRIYAWFKDGKYVFRSGQLTQHDVCVHYDVPDSGTDAQQLAAWLMHPLLPQPAPEYMCATGVLGRPLFPRTKGVWDSYEEYFERSFRATLEDRENRRTYGWMHYGDWFGERYLNYGNNEYDMAWSTALQWMRTGDRRYFERGLDMARHYSTVDTIHGPAVEVARALVWEHCFNHVGSPSTTEELKFPPDDEAARIYQESFIGMLKGAMDPQGHIFQEGNWLYAALTGDEWLRHVAERVCSHQAERLTPAFNFSIERSGGWPIINAAAAHSFTGNPYYLNAARLMIERCLQRQDTATGGWLHTPPKSETGGVPVLGGKAFAVGILTNGVLRYLEQEPEDRPEVRAMLVHGADWLMNEAWNPGKGFRYISNSPKHRDTGSRGLTCLLNAEIIAFACEETGDPKYLEFWRDMMAGLFDDRKEGMGKGFSQALRQTIFGLDRVRQWDVTEAPSPSP